MTKKPEKLMINYQVNEPKNTIVAYATVSMDNLPAILVPYVEYLGFDYPKFKIDDSTYGQFKLVTKTICCEGDTFDISTGIEVAKKKLLKKYYKIITRLITTIKETHLDRVQMELCDLQNLYEQKIEITTNSLMEDY